MSVNEYLSELCHEKFWDYNTTWNTESPQLSRCLRQTILIWLPSAFLLLSVPFEILFILKNNSRSSKWTKLKISRLGFVLFCLTLNIIELYFYVSHYVNSKLIPYVYFVGNAIKIISFTLVSGLIVLHAKRGIRTCGVLWLFFLLSFICLSPTFIQLLFKSNSFFTFEYVLNAIYFVLLTSCLLLCSFADNEVDRKQGGELLAEDEELEEESISRPPCPENFASFPSRITFSWINKLTLLGYRKPLVNDDIFDLRERDKCSTLLPKFENNLNRRSSTITNGSIPPKKSIFTGMVKTFGGTFLAAFLLKSYYDVLQFANPQLLKILLAFVREGDNEPTWHGIIIVVAMFTVSFIQLFFLNWYFYIILVRGMNIESCLISCVFKKSLIISSEAKKDSTTGEIVNLISVDVQRIKDVMPFVTLIWSCPFQIILSVFFLYREMGVATFAGVAVMVILVPLTAKFAAIALKFQNKQLSLKDERIKSLNEALNGMKVIKFYAWEQSFINLISDIRKKELHQLRNVQYLDCIGMFVWTFSPFLVAFATFGVYLWTSEDHVLTAEKVFVCLTLFDIIRFPLTNLPYLISYLILASASMKRINKFLNANEIENYVKRKQMDSAIEVDNASFSWENVENDERDGNGVLREINLNIAKGSLHVIIGNVGSGKSSLFSALLGEMKLLSGKVSIDSRLSIAYVSQQAWIENLTLRDNVLFGKPYVKEKYDAIIAACALNSDLNVLPAGDLTEIGEKGVNLSGGQKQRVSLARACYSDADLYFFDDPLSAVDAHVSKHLFENVLSSKRGILKDKTRVLVTNRIEVLPKVDKITVLENGRIREEGTYDELMSQDSDFSEFISQFSSRGDRRESESSKISENIESNENIESFSPLRRKSSTIPKDTLIEEETTEIGKVRTRIYLLYFKTMSWLWFLLLVAGSLLFEVSIAVGNVWLAHWTSDPSTGDKEKEIKQRNYRLFIYGLIGIVQVILCVLANISMVIGSIKGAITIHNRLLNRIFRSPMQFFDTTPIGRIINRFSKDMDSVDYTLPIIFKDFLICIFSFLTAIAIIAIQTVYFIVAVLPITLVYYFIQKVFIATSRQLQRLQSVARSPIFAHFSQTLLGVSTIRAFNANERFLQESNARIDFSQMFYYTIVASNRWLAVRLDFCGGLFILFAGIFAVFEKDKLSPGMVGLSVSCALSITKVLNWIVRQATQVETNIVSVERIAEYSENQTEAEWVNNDHRPAREWPQSGHIEFDKYATRYREGLDLVLKNFSASINAMEKIGIVGRTGAGKSTVTLALFRILEAVKGKIIIDGEDISRLGLHDLRERLTIIPQDPVLFSGTLRFNLDPFESYSDEEIWQALDNAYLKEFVQGLEKGLQHTISESGENLSVGQRQLICLARAILKKTKILVLDEATAAVDLETDSLIQRTIKNKFVDCTILTIAHRIHTILDYDRVMVLDKGEIVEFDSPSALLADNKTIFWSLANNAGIVG